MSAPPIHLHQFNLSANLVIITIIGLVVVYGLMAGHAKIRNLALSTYVGIVLANQLGSGLHNYLIKSHHSGIDVGYLRLALFAAPIILLEFSRRKHIKSSHAGMIVSVILSILTAGLIIGAGMSQLSAGMAKHITDSSIIAFEIYTYRLWLIAIVPVFIIAESFIGSETSGKH